MVIVGGGTAGWIAAAMLSRFVPEATAITLVESEEIATIGVGEATIPQIRFLTAGLGIDEDIMLRSTQGTFKLGIEFVDWLRPDTSYMHAFGQVGRGHGVTPFQHYWLRGLASGITAPLSDYIVSARAAAAGRFARPPLAAPAISYAFHLDAGLLAAFLRTLAETQGVRRVEGRIVGTVRTGSGDIAAVRMENGSEVVGDFFLDCSGFRALLLGEALGVGYEDWSHHLPCNRAAAVQSEGDGELLPFTRATAKPVGWQWRIPLQHRTGNGLVYASEYLSDDEAVARLARDLDGRPLSDVRTLRFTTGRRRAFWERNVVGLGLAAGFLEPLESTSIHMVQSGVGRLLELFPTLTDDPLARQTYNRLTSLEFEGVRDFLMLHYRATARAEPFWADQRQRPLPETLVDKIGQFRAGGRIRPEAHELFTEPGWLQVMVGQGIIPEHWSPLAGGMPPQDLAMFLAKIRDEHGAMVARLPLHAEFVHRYCPADAPRAGSQETSS